MVRIFRCSCTDSKSIGTPNLQKRDPTKYMKTKKKEGSAPDADTAASYSDAKISHLVMEVRPSIQHQEH